MRSPALAAGRRSPDAERNRATVVSAAPPAGRRGTPCEPVPVRLELLKPTVVATIPGTTAPERGVGADAPARPPGAACVVHVRIDWRNTLLVLLASLTLLGQGERARVDPRFRSPSTTLLTYWEALREGDADAAMECFLTRRDDQPVPGAVWFLPPTDELWLEGFNSLPVTAGRVMVRYEVHYKPRGTGEERMFPTGSELVRSHGEWRIAQPLGKASMPEWKPESLPVDI